MIKENKKIYYDMMYLVSCALNGEKANFEGINLQKIGQIAEKASILPLLGTVVPQFENSLFENTFRNTNFEICRKKLYSFFDEMNIMYCSLKGMVIKDLYPHFAMRQFADYDIWFDTSRKDEVREWMQKNSVEVLYYKEDRRGEKEDSVLFDKRFHFELHHSLFNDNYEGDPWYDYFGNEKLTSRLVKVSGSEYRMTNEDFYLFFLIHSFKHSSTVCDIRGLIDCYLINEKMSYDKEYVAQKLEEFGLTEYENNVRTVGKKVICGESLNEAEEKYFLDCASNQTFGDLQLNELRRIANGGEITEDIRKKAIRNIFIVPTEHYKQFHPVVYYSVVLRPFYHFGRIITKLLNWNETKKLIEKYKTVGL